MQQTTNVLSRALLLAAGAAMLGGLTSAADAALTLDVFAVGQNGVETKSPTVAPGGQVTLNVYALATGTTAAAESFQSAFFGVQANAGTLSTVTLAAPFNATGSSGGTASGSYVGGASNLSADGWVYARAAEMQGPGQKWRLGTLTYTAGNTTGTASLNAVTRTQPADNFTFHSALWVEDGGLKTATSGSYTVGQALSIMIGNSILLGDVNGDGNVNGLDINPFVFALVNGKSLFETQYPTGSYAAADTSNDGSVNGLDINPFVQILVGGGADPVAVQAALVAVPEPGVLGLMGLGLLGLTRRRVRQH